MKSFGEKEFIKLNRKIIHWQWYSDTPTRSVFLHCLIMANWSCGEWKGISYERGEFITSLPSLSKELGLSIQEIRTALNHLKSTGEIIDRPTNKSRIITVVNYDKYQAANSETGQQADIVTKVLQKRKGDKNQQAGQQDGRVQESPDNAGVFCANDDLSNRQANSLLTGNQQATNRQLTADKEYKNIKNKKNIKKKDIMPAAPQKTDDPFGWDAPGWKEGE